MAAPQAASAQVDTAVTATCSFPAHTRDRDPAGTNLRAAPRRDAPVIARLPTGTRGQGTDDVLAAEFTVRGSRDGWFLIRDARLPGLDGPPRRVFAGPGWISGSLLGFTAGDHELRAAPSPDAPSLLRLLGETAGGGWGPDAVTIERAHGCQGAFVEASIRTPDGRRARGWLTRICSGQVTTCP